MSSYTEHDVTKTCAFWGMVISGFAYLLSGVIKFVVSLIGEISGSTATVLNQIISLCTFLGNIAIVVAIAIPAWHFVKYRRKAWKVVYWIAFVGFALGSVLGLLGGLGIFG